MTMAMEKLMEQKDKDRPKLLWSSDDFDNEDDFLVREAKNNLIKLIKNRTKEDAVRIVSNKINWRGVPGYMLLDLREDYKTIFYNLYPKEECTFELFEDNDGLYAIVSTHDTPTGATWRFNSKYITQGDE